MGESQGPEPQTQSKLGPPRRRPPTAVGADTLPSPRGRPSDLSISAVHTFARPFALLLVSGLLILLLWLVAPAILPTIVAGLAGSLLAVALVYLYRVRLPFLVIALAPLAAGAVASAVAAVRIAPFGFTGDISGVALQLVVGLGLGVLSALTVCLVAFAWLRAWHVYSSSRIVARLWESGGRGA